MEKKKIEQIDKTILTLEEFFIALKDPAKLKIIMLLSLNGEDKSLSFAEIQTYLGKEYSSPVVSYHLRGLEKKGIITNDRRLDTSTGKARSSFYRLTDKGKQMVEVLAEIKNRWEKDLLSHG